MKLKNSPSRVNAGSKHEGCEEGVREKSCASSEV